MTSTNQPSKENNEDIIEQARRIRALHAIISRPDLTFDQQIDEALRLGCTLLGTEIGKLGRQHPETNTSEFLNTVVTSDVPAKRGVVLPFDKTYCNITFNSADAVVISDVTNSPYKNHPAVEFLGIHCYIGCSINVHGKKFGTVNFSNRKPLSHPFTAADKDLVSLIGSWISIMMERQIEAEELKKAKEDAERANLAKSAFLANMSHEIRTPLTAIIGFVELASDEKQNPQERLAALNTIRRSSDHLLHLINDVLDLSKVEAGELDCERQPINTHSLVNEVESIVHAQAKLKNLNFSTEYSYPLPISFHSDNLRIKQILLNLCSNAVKFTGSGSIRIVTSYHPELNKLAFKVHDTGIGLTPEQCSNVFLPFKQANASIAKRYGGTGLGLHLSRRIAELLGGSLTVTSEFGKGSCFEFALQLKSSDAGRLANSYTEFKTQAIAGESIDECPQVSGRILVVEDDELNQILLNKYLERMGATITIANNGEMALRYAERTVFDLVFMDMQMPVMSGIEALRELRARNYPSPIVMLTANATVEDRNQCLEAGCNEFLTKPFVKDKIFGVVTNYLPSAKKPPLQAS